MEKGKGWIPYRRSLREWFLYKIIGLYGYVLCYGKDTDILYLVPKSKLTTK